MIAVAEAMRWGRLRRLPAAHSTVHGGGQWSLLGLDARRLGEVVPADVNDPWYPPAPEVVQALSAALAAVQHTPEVRCELLRRSLGTALGLDEERLLVGAGSSPVLHELISHTCGPGRPLLVVAPTYSEYPRIARLAGAPIYALELEPGSDYTIDPDELSSAARQVGAALVVLANPNNPTGLSLEADRIERLIGELPERCRLLVDEAYVDQDPACSVLHHTGAQPRLAVVHSLSKGAALAGARLGYGAIGDAWFDALPSKSPPWPVSLFAQTAALPALAARAYVRRRVAETRRLRRALVQSLGRLPGLEPLPTRCHFFLVRTSAPWPSAPEVVGRLSRRGVLVRDGSPYGPPLGDRFLRVTCRSLPENRRIVDAFRAVLQEVR